VVIVLNDTLSIPNALKRERCEDYYKNTATIEWPLGPGGEAFPIMGSFYPAVTFRAGRNVETAKEFVRFLVGEAGSPTISTSPGSASCRPCRSCARGRSGSIQAIRTAWPP
jgi:hypothetical protein